MYVHAGRGAHRFAVRRGSQSISIVCYWSKADYISAVRQPLRHWECHRHGNEAAEGNSSAVGTRWYIVVVVVRLPPLWALPFSFFFFFCVAFLVLQKHLASSSAGATADGGETQAWEFILFWMQDPARWRGLVVFWVFGSRIRGRYYLNTQWTERWWDQEDESENNGVRIFGVACPKEEKSHTACVCH